MSVSEHIIRAAGHRKRANRDHAEVAEQSALAFADRRIAAHDRELAACERLHALVDRELLADALANAEVDPLTRCAHTGGGTGLADLDRELLCCHRTGRGLVVVYVDVVGLKVVNDTEGHHAGDELLVRMVAMLKQHLRSYDLIVRLGGDEFLCVMSGVALPEVRRRFIRIAAMLADAPRGAAIRTGFAELAPADSTASLIARADEQMIGRGR
ncbi:MAG TPA: diguanylate cyclase [Solirubrobacteraceae bacterium]|nr:diguanylate cyclase [Solirubrobacteraceae bacterium]